MQKQNQLVRYWTTKCKNRNKNEYSIKI